MKPEFFLLVTGSRDAVAPQHCDIIRREIERIAAKVPPEDWEWNLVHGAAAGVDSYCAHLVQVLGFCTPDNVIGFPAQWEHDGKAAGPLRNQRMVDYVVEQRDRNYARVGCVAFPALQDVPQKKGGTMNCIAKAEKWNIKVHTVALDVREEREARLRRRNKA